MLRTGTGVERKASNPDRVLDSSDDDEDDADETTAIHARQTSLSAVILDFSRVVNVDMTTCRELSAVAKEYREAGVALVVAAAPGVTRDILDRAEAYVLCCPLSCVVLGPSPACALTTRTCETGSHQASIGTSGCLCRRRYTTSLPTPS